MAPQQPANLKTLIQLVVRFVDVPSSLSNLSWIVHFKMVESFCIQKKLDTNRYIIYKHPQKQTLPCVTLHPPQKKKTNLRHLWVPLQFRQHSTKTRWCWSSTLTLRLKSWQPNLRWIPIRSGRIHQTIVYLPGTLKPNFLMDV